VWCAWLKAKVEWLKVQVERLGGLGIRFKA